jgi:ADP-heptose:LPS heptosyltransferase
MGDVALTSPVIESVLEAHPDVKITFLSRGFFEPLFNKKPNFKFKSADLKGNHKGLLGLRKLYKELKLEEFDAVLDLHDVLRTKVLGSFFKLSGTPVFTIDKGRKQKQQLIDGKIRFQELKHTQERYLDVFARADFKTSLKPDAFLRTETNQVVREVVSSFNLKENQKLIGIAPFAAHESKELGLAKIKDLIKELTVKQSYFVVLFGGGKVEKEKLEQLATEFEHCESIVGKLQFNEELILIKQLDTMVAMDSGNMHLASLVGTKVVSIWGPTHPFLGFSPYNNKDYMVQVSIEELPCRPCTVYGKLKTESNKKCARKAMKGISIEMIMNKINASFKPNHE